MTLATMPTKCSICLTFTNSGREIIIEPYALGMFHFPDAEPRFFQSCNSNQKPETYNVRR